jgi:hypothetical protein
MPSKPLCRWNNRHRPLLSRTLKTESVGRGFDPRQPRWKRLVKHAREWRTGPPSKEGRLGVARCLGKHGV